MKRCPECRGEFGDEIDFCPRDGVRLINPDALKMDPLIGAILENRYQILSRLGEGGMGVVYLAEHQAIGKQVAVKVLKKELCTDDHVAERFHREAKAACKVGNPHIIEINDYGSLPDGRLFLVMELLKGEDLDTMLDRESPVDIETIKIISLQVCDGLQAAHEKGIIHRDIKPENLFLTDFKDNILVKILDFGIAKSHNLDSSGTLTKTGVIFGTPNYMSPEQARGDGADKRSDIYSFGIILYQMATGRLPFTEDTAVQVLVRHIAEEPIAPKDVAPHLPAAIVLNDIIVRAVQKDPDARFQSFREMAQELERITSDVPRPRDVSPRERPTGVTRALDKPPSPSSQISQNNTVRLDKPGGRGRLMAVAAVGATLALAVVLYLVTRKEATPKPHVVGMKTVSLYFDAGQRPRDRQAPQDALAQTPDHTALLATPVRLQTVPTGAEVIIEGRSLGKTPLEVHLGDKTVKVAFRLEGYEEASRAIEPSSEKVVAVDMSPKAAKKPPKRRVTPKGSGKSPSSFKPLDEGFKNPFE